MPENQDRAPDRPENRPNDSPSDRPMSEYLHQIPVEQVIAKKRWVRDDWIVFAMDALEQEGLAALRIEELARRAQRTTGSFYAHFKSRDELLEAVLEAWIAFKLEQAMRLASQMFHAGDFTLGGFLSMFRKNKFQLVRMNLEMAVRDWAHYDERARATVMRLDSLRMNNATAMLRSEFPEAAHPQVFSLLFLWILYGSSVVVIDPSEQALLDSQDLAAEAFVQMYRSTAGAFNVPKGPRWKSKFTPRPVTALPGPQVPPATPVPAKTTPRPKSARKRSPP